tara:strand:- start:3455 stop:4543 length:1089 start_codon:yes stop_codon:yes gene_type:complete
MKKIFVTQPSLPDLKTFSTYLEKIWNTKILSNVGEFHKEFEEKLKIFLDAKHISIYSNGTLALINTIKAFDLSGEIITTPYSYVATANSILWNNIKPVFVDIDEKTGNIDPSKIENKISDKTTAILAVHVYARPCDVSSLEKISKSYNLKLIYDAAHCFGAQINGQSLCSFGDASIISFHATKVFNTIEGGAVITNSKIIKSKLDKLKNYGFENETSIVLQGMNAKLNELQAAYGLLQLKSHEENVSKREKIYLRYKKNLSLVKGIAFMNEIKGLKWNYCYCPIFVTKKYPISRDDLYFKLQNSGYYGRRYFYPLITDFKLYGKYKSKFLKAKALSDSVICLPIYPDLELDDVDAISKIITN